MFNTIYKAAAITVAAIAPTALAGMSYDLTPTTNGMNQRTLDWGETFTIDLALTGDSMPAFNSAIFQLRFTEPGLMLMNYAWDAPFGTGDIFDDSTPGSSELPMMIDGDTHADPQTPSLIDIEFSNVSIAGSYSGGDIVSLTLAVPANFGYVGALFVTVAPDTFASGFTNIPVEGGQVLQLDIVPTPGAASLLGIAALTTTRRRRKN